MLEYAEMEKLRKDNEQLKRLREAERLKWERKWSQLTNSLSSAPFWGVASSLSPPIGGGHASFPRHRDRWFFTSGECSAVFSFCTQPPKNLPPHGLEFWRETSPRLLPSRGECRHTVHVGCGCRLMVLVVVGEVALSRAGRMMYGGSEEYDVEARSMMSKRGI